MDNLAHDHRASERQRLDLDWRKLTLSIYLHSSFVGNLIASS